MDLRKYREVVKKTLKEVRAKDKNNSWSIKSITKDKIKFNWSYLEKDEYFSIRVDDFEDEPELKDVLGICVIGAVPGEHEVEYTEYINGDYGYDESFICFDLTEETIGYGIAKIIRDLSSWALSVY